MDSAELTFVNAFLMFRNVFLWKSMILKWLVRAVLGLFVSASMRLGFEYEFKFIIPMDYVCNVCLGKVYQYEKCDQCKEIVFLLCKLFLVQ